MTKEGSERWILNRSVPVTQTTGGVCEVSVEQGRFKVTTK